MRQEAAYRTPIAPARGVRTRVMLPETRRDREKAMPSLRSLTLCLCTGLMLGVLGAAGDVHAETNEVRISKGYGMHYLPLYVMEAEKLLEKHAAAAGLGDVKVSWPVFDGGNIINDAMLAGALDIAAIGVPGFLTLWDKGKANPRTTILGLAAVGSGSVYLNTRNPNIKTLADFTEKDRIAVPGIKTSLVAVVLQMAAAQVFGIENYAKLD